MVLITSTDASDQSGAVAGIHSLPQVLDFTQAQPLHELMATCLRDPAAIVLDAGEVEQMSTPCAQVLLAAGRGAVAADRSLIILNASAVFRTAVADLGLQPEFSQWME